MRKLVSLLIVFCLWSPNGRSQTTVSGGIYQNTTWTTTGSPYIVNGSVVVFPGVTLTIQSGVEIRINNQSSNTIFIETRGKLNCVGTDALPIKIRTLQDTTNVGWQGFVCTNAQGGVLNADRFQISNADIAFSYGTPPTNLQYTNCSFRRCNQAVNVANTVVLNQCRFVANNVAVYGWSYFTLNNCLFQGNATAVQAYSTAFNMADCQFINNQMGLTFSSNVFDSLRIEDCEFVGNDVALNYPNNGVVRNCSFSNNDVAIQAAYECTILDNDFFSNELAVEASVRAEVSNNRILNNIGGLRIASIASAAESPIVQNNSICGSTVFNVDNATNVNYSLLSNCFCGLDSAQIELYLLDGYDDITKGLINYSIYDTNCTSVLTSVLKFNPAAGLLDAVPFATFENPVHHELKIIGKTELQSLQLIDFVGRRYLLQSSGSATFDVSHLPAGTYTLMDAKGQPMRQKLVKI